MNALFTENKNLNIINHDLHKEIERLEGLGQRQTTDVAEWKKLFSFYQNLAIEFAKELQLLVPPKFDPYAPISLLAQEEKIKRIKNVSEQKEELDLTT